MSLATTRAAHRSPRPVPSPTAPLASECASLRANAERGELIDATCTCATPAAAACASRYECSARRRAGGAGRRRHFRRSPRRRHDRVPASRLVGRAGRRGPRAGSASPAHPRHRLARRRRRRWMRRSTPADQADAIAAVLDALGIERLQAFVGSSYGAMVGLQFAARHPARLRTLVAISGAHRAHPFSSAWRALQRQAVALGALQCDETHGLALARQLAILSYRTPEEFAERFAGAAGRQWPRARRRRGLPRPLRRERTSHARRRPPSCACPNRSTCSRSIPNAIRVPVTWLPSPRTGWCRSRTPTRWSSACAARPRLRVLRSRYGHDAFLKEEAAIAAVLHEALGARRRSRGMSAPAI